MATIPNWVLRILLWLFVFLPLFIFFFFFLIGFQWPQDPVVAHILLAIWLVWFLYSIYKVIISLFKKHEEEFVSLLGQTQQLAKEMGRNRKRFALSLQNEIKYIDYDEIMRCEASNTYTIFYFNTKESVVATKPLKEYADLLAPNGFLRTHQSHLVNPKYVKSWLKEDGGILLMNNGDKIPVSKPNREAVKQVLQEL